MSESLSELWAPVTAPSKQWRNKWRVRGVTIIFACGRAVGPGVHVGGGEWPSKEIAEQVALDRLRESMLDANGMTVPFRRYVEWLGAHPAEEGGP